MSKKALSGESEGTKKRSEKSSVSCVRVQRQYLNFCTSKASTENFCTSKATFVPVKQGETLNFCTSKASAETCAEGQCAKDSILQEVAP